MPVSDRLCDRLYWLMEVHGTSASALGEACGRGASAIYCWCAGKNAMPAEALKHIADYYGVSADWLLGRTNER